MDNQFLKERAKEIRDLAERADPFIKKRLLDLADNYDVRIGRPSNAVRALIRPPVSSSEQS